MVVVIFYRRNPEDLADWIVRILYGNTDDEQDREDLQGIAGDCISGWPYLEMTIERIAGRLAQRGSPTVARKSASTLSMDS